MFHCFTEAKVKPTFATYAVSSWLPQTTQRITKARSWQCREKVVMKCHEDSEWCKIVETFWNCTNWPLQRCVWWFLSGFEGAIGLRGPFGSVCMNKREPDSSLPSQPLPPRLSVVRGEEEGSIALRITFSDHRRGVFSWWHVSNAQHPWLFDRCLRVIPEFVPLW